MESTTTFLFLSNRPAAEKFKKFFEAPELGSRVHHPFTLLKSATSKLGLTDDELIDFAQRCTLEDNAPLIHDVVVQGRRVASNLAPGDEQSNAFTRLFELMALKAGVDGEANQTFNRQDVLKAFNVFREEQLLPAPAHFEPVTDLLPRPEVNTIRQKLTSTTPCPLIIIAEGGVGKTVFMQQLANELGDNHETLIFDCFAGGRYRNDADRRHLPTNALTQIVNQLSLRGLCKPLIHTGKRGNDFLRVVRERLVTAAQNSSKSKPNGKLALFIDAADNAVEAARDKKDDCFATWLFEELYTDPIPGVALIMSCRDYRKDLLTMRQAVDVIPLLPFDKPTTFEFLARRDSSLTELQMIALFARSGGNPRVLDYLLRTEDTNLEADGVTITVDMIIAKRVDEAMLALKDGGASPDEQDRLLAALVRLSPPIPLDALAEIAQVPQNRLKSFVVDLHPILEQSREGLMFRDEPAKDWAQSKVDSTAGALPSLVDALLRSQDASPFVAHALPTLLGELGDKERALALALSDDYPPNLTTKIARQRLKLHRLREALRLCALERDLSATLRLLFEHSLVQAVEARSRDFVQDYPELAGLSNNSDARRRLMEDDSGWRGAAHARRALLDLCSKQVDTATLHSLTFSDCLGARDEADPLIPQEIACLAGIELVNGQFDVAIKQTLRANPDSFQLEVARAVIRLAHTLGVPLEPYIDALIASEQTRPVSTNATGAALACLEALMPRHHLILPLIKMIENKLAPKSVQFSKRHDKLETIVSGPVALHAACLAASVGRKTAVRQLLRSFEWKSPQPYEYYGRLDTLPVANHATIQALKAFLNNRSVSWSDLLPGSLRRKQLFKNVSSKKDMAGALASHSKSKPKTKGRGFRQTFSDREQAAIVWTVAVMHSYATDLTRAWCGDVPERQSILDAAMDNFSKEPSNYQLYDERFFLSKMRRGLTLRLLPYLLNDKSNTNRLLDGVQAVSKKMYHLQYIELVRMLSQVNGLQDTAGAIAIEATQAVKTETEVTQRVEHFAELAHAIVRVDPESAKTLFIHALEELDNVGTEDFDIFNGLLQLACRQKGGWIDAQGTNRFLNLCEINLHDTSRFPWNEFSDAVAASFGYPALARLSRWDRRDIADIDCALSMCLSKLAGHAVPSELAYALFALAPVEGYSEETPSRSAARIVNKAEASQKAVITNGLYRFMHLEGSRSEARALLTRTGFQAQPEPVFSSLGFWSLPKPQPRASIETDSPYERDLDDLEDGPKVDISLPTEDISEETIYEIVKALGGKPINDTADNLARWAIDKCKTADTRSKFIDAVIATRALASFMRIRVLNHVLNAWEPHSLGLRSQRKAFAKRVLENHIIAITAEDRLPSTLRDLERFCNMPRGELAFITLSLIARERAPLNTNDTFWLANDLLDAAEPEIGREALSRILNSDTFDLGDVAPENTDGASDHHEAASPSEAAIGLIWSQLGHNDAAKRWRAAHAVCRLAETNQIDVLKALVKNFDQPPKYRFIPEDQKFGLWNARQWLLFAIERGARLYPEAIRPLKSWLATLSKGAIGHPTLIRTAANALVLMNPALLPNKRGLELNKEPSSPFKPVPKTDYVVRHRLSSDEIDKQFYFDYDFEKYEPHHTANIFVPHSGYATDPKVQLIDKIKKIDPDLDNMHDNGGAPPSGYSDRRYGQQRFQRYGTQVVEHALQLLSYDWLQTHPVKISEWGDEDPWNDHFNSSRLTLIPGLWLHDRTSFAPDFTSLNLINMVDDEPTFKSLEPLLNALGWSDKATTSLVVSGNWIQSGSVSVSVVSALTRRHGAIGRSSVLAKRDYYDCWLPSLADHWNESESYKRESAGFTAWVDIPDGEPKIDEWDFLGSPLASRNHAFGQNIAKEIGLTRSEADNRLWTSKSGVGAGAVAWGKKSVRREDPDHTGKMLAIDRKLLDAYLRGTKQVLVIRLRLSYTNPHRFSSRDKKRADIGHLLICSPETPLRLFKLKGPVPLH